MDGIILIDKPAGLSSFGVVARVRWLLTQQAGHKVKVGHTGTLDPFATGLVILVIGKACRDAGQFSKSDKTYQAGVMLGQSSTTGDPEGIITAVPTTAPAPEAVAAALNTFRGQITQIPPAFSAIKVNGQRAYKLARRGETVDIPPRQVTVNRLETISYDYPQLDIVCDVSSGTYIRTLAEDIGQTLGTAAYCNHLRRTRVGKYDLKDALNFDNLNAELIVNNLVTDY